MVIGGPGDTGTITQIWSDDAGAITEAVRYLVALGHRRIARVGGLPDLLHTQTRTRAFDGGLRLARASSEAVTVPVRLHRRGGRPGHPPAADRRATGRPRSSTTTT